jgi:hypothetical protein
MSRRIGAIEAGQGGRWSRDSISHDYHGGDHPYSISSRARQLGQTPVRMASAALRHREPPPPHERHLTSPSRSRSTEVPRRDCNNAGNLRQLNRGLPANLDGDPALPIAYHDRKIAALFSTWSTQSRREFCTASDRDFSQAATLGFGLRENHSPVVLLTGTSCAMVEIQARDAAQCALAVAPRYGAVHNQRAMRLGIGWRSAG